MVVDLNLFLFGLELFNVADLGFDELLEVGEEAAGAGGFGALAAVIHPVAGFEVEEEAVEGVESRGDGEGDGGEGQDGVEHGLGLIVGVEGGWWTCEKIILGTRQKPQMVVFDGFEPSLQQEVV
jgi:hypothetical protein